MEFITDITVSIDAADYKDPRRLEKILRSYRAERRGSCFSVRGTFEELERLSVILSAARRASTQAGAVEVEVEVSGAIMAYILQRRAEELSRIQGSSFVLETQPDVAAGGDTVRVAFRPRHGSAHAACPVHADYVRRRFVTFYQRTAADLQVATVAASLRRHKDLQRRFPLLLFEAGRDQRELTTTGPFMHVADLKKFLAQNSPSASKRPASGGRAEASGPEDDSCPICMDTIAAGQRKTLRCQHSFCRDCLSKAFDYKPVCPTCGQLYGTLRGTQPDGGRMDVSTNASSLPGYEQHGTIVIHYCIPSGIQKEEHPHPGQPYEGVSRTAYLPDCPEGRRILELLRRAFRQRLVFTVGRSSTSGRNNAVTWNDIHHKTSTHGGPTRYGFPDPDYLSRVRDELKVKGLE